MKGLILAGGRATRLRPLTYVTNKHLLPVYQKPMIYYSLEAMRRAGVQDVLITTNPEHAGDFINLLRSGADFGLRLSYEIQDDSVGGIAQAIGLAESFTGSDKLLVLLGDNIFTHDLSGAVKVFERRPKGAMIFGKEVEHPEHYGVIELRDDGRVKSIVEKPKRPKGNLAQTGVYLYDNRVFDFARKLKPSDRGELEVTDLNNVYVKEGTMKVEVMDGYWIDAGTSADELLAAGNRVAELKEYFAGSQPGGKKRIA
ncbi:MAG: sugar phosphate nucleotidyltransferase [bacterium]|nr:sugar phosphate nucleotidyltransferase [bacterium]MDZ4247872.1 sugar phosphate nucleotidyltransferase [Patescibacteria group bacterium]